MIRSKNALFSGGRLTILLTNSSRVGKAISDSSLIGVPSCFSGGRKMVKCTRSTDGSDFRILRQVRSPSLGSPETKSTRSLSRTPSIDTTARLLTGVSSPPGSGAALGDRHIDVLLLPDRNVLFFQHLAVAPDRDLGGGFVGAVILDAIADGLRLADDAEARRRDQRDAAV